VLCLDAADLAANFEPLRESYKEDETGEAILTLIRRDWGLFSGPGLHDKDAEVLLAELGFEGSHRWRALAPDRPTSRDQWEEFRDEILRSNRYWPRDILDFARLAELVPSLAMHPNDIGSTWYRARVHEGRRFYDRHELGAPPPDKTRNGRANPAGIPYLYLASSAETAMAEVRPPTGAFVTIGAFEILPAQEIVDLYQPRNSFSPFRHLEEDMAIVRADLDFLETLGRELSRPVLPSEADIEYVPSQFVCEYLKSIGYAGVLYQSSQATGVNLALFDAAAAVEIDRSCHIVQTVVVEPKDVNCEESNPAVFSIKSPGSM
jgi:hypothetical protein